MSIITGVLIVVIVVLAITYIALDVTKKASKNKNGKRRTVYI